MGFDPQLVIGKRRISDADPCFVIAEAGVNHDGSLARAKMLVDAAVGSGVDAVKFQLFDTDLLIVRDVGKAPYQERNKASGSDQYSMLKSLELPIEAHRELARYCESRGVMYLCTPYDALSLQQLVDLGVAALKIASTDLTNLLLLEEAAAAPVPVILSTGMSSLFEVDRAVATFAERGKRDLALLHCTSDYPVRDAEVHLSEMSRLRSLFGCLCGFSDHTEGVGAAPYAVALGARIIEKHFTLDRALPGPDHRASLEPAELRDLVKAVRRAESLVGVPGQRSSAEDTRNKRFLQKSLVAARDLPKGTVVARDDLAAKRTGGKGLSPLVYSTVVGRRTTRDLRKDAVIDAGDLA
jgi:N,N'-diacetyllegionaminate synthase